MDFFIFGQIDKNLLINVLFIPYFCLLVFGILVNLVAWFSVRFFQSCPSCLTKCKQRLLNIFVTSSSKVNKNQNWKMGRMKHKWSTESKFIWKFIPIGSWADEGRFQLSLDLITDARACSTHSTIAASVGNIQS